METVALLTVLGGILAAHWFSLSDNVGSGK